MWAPTVPSLTFLFLSPHLYCIIIAILLLPGLALSAPSSPPPPLSLSPTGHLCLVLGADLLCVGRNPSGVLGLPDATTDRLGEGLSSHGQGTNSSLADPLPIATYEEVTEVCAVVVDGYGTGGGVTCWDGSTAPTGAACEDGSNSDDPGLPLGVVAAGWARSEEEMPAATCAWNGCGLVRCIGSNVDGVLGAEKSGAVLPVPDKPISNVPRAVFRGIAQLNTAIGGANLHCPSPTPPRYPNPDALPTDVVMGAASRNEFSACMLFSNGDVRCMGTGTKGATGYENRDPVGRDPCSMSGLEPIGFNSSLGTVTKMHLTLKNPCATFSTGSTVCWGVAGPTRGDNDTAILGIKSGDMTSLVPLSFSDTAPIVSMDASPMVTCALFAGGGVRCWGVQIASPSGKSTLGIMGQGVTDQKYGVDAISTIPYIPFAADGTAAAQVEMMDQNACALFKNATFAGVRCWGHRKGVDILPAIADASVGIGDFPGEIETLPYFNLGTTLTPVRIAAAGTALCVMFDAGPEGDGHRVKCSDTYTHNQPAKYMARFSFLVPYPPQRLRDLPFISVGRPVMDMAAPFPRGAPFRGGTSVRFPHRGYLSKVAPTARFGGVTSPSAFVNYNAFHAAAPPRPDFAGPAGVLSSAAMAASVCTCSTAGNSTAQDCATAVGVGGGLDNECHLTGTFAMFPAGTPACLPYRTVPLEITGDDGNIFQHDTVKDFVYYTEPNITSITPSTGPYEGGTEVTLIGSGLGCGPVNVNGTAEWMQYARCCINGAPVPGPLGLAKPVYNTLPASSAYVTGRSCVIPGLYPTPSDPRNSTVPLVPGVPVMVSLSLNGVDCPASDMASPFVPYNASGISVDLPVKSARYTGGTSIRVVPTAGYAHVQMGSDTPVFRYTESKNNGGGGSGGGGGGGASSVVVKESVTAAPGNVMVTPDVHKQFGFTTSGKVVTLEWAPNGQQFITVGSVILYSRVTLQIAEPRAIPLNGTATLQLIGPGITATGESRVSFTFPDANQTTVVRDVQVTNVHGLRIVVSDPPRFDESVPATYNFSGQVEIKVALNGIDFDAAGESLDPVADPNPSFFVPYYAVDRIVPRCGPSTGGSEITVTGRGFVNVGPDLQCRFADVSLVGSYPGAGTIAYSATPAFFVSSTQVVCVAPSLTVNPVGYMVSVTMLGIGGNGWSFGDMGDVDGDAVFIPYVNPTVTGVAPSAVPEGTFGSTTLTLFGVNFPVLPGTETPHVQFGSGAIYDPVPCVRAAGVGIICPNVPERSGLVFLTVLPNQQDIAKGNALVAFHSLESAEPSSGSVLGGTNVNLLGFGFLEGEAHWCWFRVTATPEQVAADIIAAGLDPASYALPTSAASHATVGVVANRISPAVLVCSSPPTAKSAGNVIASLLAAGVIGSVTAEVRVSRGEHGTRGNALAFDYFRTPVVTRVEPSVGPPSGGALVTVTATGAVPPKLRPTTTCLFAGLSAPAVEVVQHPPVPGAGLSSLTVTVVCVAPEGVGASEVTLTLNGVDAGEALQPYSVYTYFEAERLETRYVPEQGDPGNEFFVSGSGFLAENATVCRLGGVGPSNAQGSVIVGASTAARALASAAAAAASVSNSTPATAGSTDLVIPSAATVAKAQSDSVLSCGALPPRPVPAAGAPLLSPNDPYPLYLSLHPETSYLVPKAPPGGISMLSVYFYQDASVTSISPRGGSSSGGLPVTLYGSRLAALEQSGGCKFGRTPGLFTWGPESPAAAVPSLPPNAPGFNASLAPNTAICVTPPGSGTLVAVVSRNGKSFTDPLASSSTAPEAEIDAVSFTYYSVVSVSPTTGPDTGGTLVTVLGSGFAKRIGVSAKCRFGPSREDVPATIVSEAVITCVVPPRRPGTLRRVRSSSSSSASASMAKYSRQGGGGGGGGGGVTGSTAPQPLAIVETVDVQVSFGNGGWTKTATSASSYALHSTILVSTLSPSVGPTAGGTIVTVSGDNFFDLAALTSSSNTPVNGTAGAVHNGTAGSGTNGTDGVTTGASFQVRFGVNKVPVDAEFLSSTSLRVTTPATQTGKYEVWVSANGDDWFGPSTNAFSFVSCPAGEYSASYIEECRPCPLGTYNDQTGKNNCKRCPTGEYVAFTGATACVKCPANSTVPESEEPTSVSKCVCVAGHHDPLAVYYANQKGEGPPGGRSCAPCPLGAECPGGVLPPVPAVGYWTSVDHPTTFLECRGPGAPGCTGGGVSACTHPHTGRMCTDCLPGYYLSGTSCSKCGGHAWLVLSLFALLCVFLVGVAVAVGARVSRVGGAVGVVVMTFQIVVLIGEMPVGWDPLIGKLIGYLRVPFTLSLEAAMAECVIGSLGYKERWIVGMSLPLLFAVAVLAVHGIGRARIALSRGSQARKAKLVSVLTSRVVSAGLLLATLFYLTMARTTMSHFDCTLKADGSWSLDAYPALPCGSAEPTANRVGSSAGTTTAAAVSTLQQDDGSSSGSGGGATSLPDGSWWYAYMPIASAGVVLYCMGLPAVTIAVARVGRFRTRDRQFVRRFGVLTGPYDASRPRQECWVCLEKMALAGVSVFVDHVVGFQIAVLLAMLVAGLVAHERAHPYRIPRDNFLSSVMRWTVLSIGCLATLVNAGRYPASAVGSVIIVAFFACIGIVALMVIGVVAEDIVGAAIARLVFRMRHKGEKGAHSLVTDAVALSSKVTHLHAHMMLESWLTSHHASIDDVRDAHRVMRRALWCLEASSGNGNGNNGNIGQEDDGETSFRADPSRLAAARDPVAVSIVDDVTLRVLKPEVIAPFAGWLTAVAMARANGNSGIVSTHDLADAAATVRLFVSYTRYAEMMRRRGVFGFLSDILLACVGGGSDGTVPSNRTAQVSALGGKSTAAGSISAVPLFSRTVSSLAAEDISANQSNCGAGEFDRVRVLASALYGHGPYNSLAIARAIVPGELDADVPGEPYSRNHINALVRTREDMVASLARLMVLSARDPVSDDTRLWAMRAAISAASLDTEAEGDNNDEGVDDIEESQPTTRKGPNASNASIVSPRGEGPRSRLSLVSLPANGAGASERRRVRVGGERTKGPSDEELLSLIAEAEEIGVEIDQDGIDLEIDGAGIETEAEADSETGTMVTADSAIVSPRAVRRSAAPALVKVCESPMVRAREFESAGIFEQVLGIFGAGSASGPPLPGAWTTEAGTIVDLPTDSAEFQAVRALVENGHGAATVSGGTPIDFSGGRDTAASGHMGSSPELRHVGVVVTRVSRVQNKGLFERYRSTVAAMRATLAEENRAVPHAPVATEIGGHADAISTAGGFSLATDVNEVLLLHGSRGGAVDIISKEGFDPRVSTSGMFGDGIYFCESIGKADQYTSDGGGGDRKAVLARVALGDPFIATSPMKYLRRPPCVEGHVEPCPCRKHDTLLAEIRDNVKSAALKRYREFVVYLGTGAYPSYVITYKRRMEDGGGATTDTETETETK